MHMAAPLHLSVLDQAPVPEGRTAADALANSLDLAQHVDRLGYTRLWYSEHHAMPLLAGSAPELLVARAVSFTQKIRVGSGGIMLPHYSPLKVAEVFSTLTTMFGDRIDLGVGRAPGGGQLEAYALKRYRDAPTVDDFPQQLAELRAFLDPSRWALHSAGGFSESDARGAHPFSRIHVAPSPGYTPQLWLLGSSMWSSMMAAKEGLPYAFAHFFSAQGTRDAITHYQRNFKASEDLAGPEATIAIGAIVADTQEEAEHLHASVRLLQRRIRMDDRRPVATPDDALQELNEVPAQPKAPWPIATFPQDQPEGEFPRYVVGTPTKVRDELLHIASELKLQELIINTITHSHEARKRSYALLAEAFDLHA
jgi:luciferase family oxidoreductase group 1